MAWRPAPYLIAGELDNTERQRVTGWIRFMGLKDQVTVDLEGEFHRDIRGATIRFYADIENMVDAEKAAEYMHLFETHQTGKAGDITAGLPPRDYVSYPYIEWYSDQNGRVVLELKQEQLQVVGRPIPVCESDPICRREQERNMLDHLYHLYMEFRSQSGLDDRPQEPPAPQQGGTPDE